MTNPLRAATPPSETSRLTDILDVLRRHRGRAQAISAPNLELVVGIPERTIRRELEIAHADGVLEELELPAVGISGVGFFIATHVEDFQAAYDVAFRARRALDRKLASISKLARSFGLRLITKPTNQ